MVIAVAKIKRNPAGGNGPAESASKAQKQIDEPKFLLKIKRPVYILKNGKIASVPDQPVANLTVELTYRTAIQQAKCMVVNALTSVPGPTLVDLTRKSGAGLT